MCNHYYACAQYITILNRARLVSHHHVPSPTLLISPYVSSVPLPSFTLSPPPSSLIPPAPSSLLPPSLHPPSPGTYLLSGGEECVLVVWQLASCKSHYRPRLGAQITRIACAPADQSFAISLQNNSKYVRVCFFAVFSSETVEDIEALVVLGDKNAVILLSQS